MRGIVTLRIALDPRAHGAEPPVDALLALSQAMHETAEAAGLAPIEVEASWHRAHVTAGGGS
jgi:hypothetical protein